MFPTVTDSLVNSTHPYWPSIGLGVREGTFGTFQLFFLLISLILVVTAKAVNTHSYSVVMRIFFFPRKSETQIREGWPLLGSPAWLLAMNFVITFAHSIYLIIGRHQTESLGSVLLSLGISFGFFGLAFIAMFLVAFLTGVRSIYQVPLQTTWVLPQFVGIVFFLLNLIWVLNPEFSVYLEWALMAVFFVLSFKRIIRSSVYLLRKGIEWYYILLYLCTLEILPLSILAWFLYTWML